MRCNHQIASLNLLRIHYKTECTRQCNKTSGNLICKVKCKEHQKLHFPQIDKSANVGNRLKIKLSNITVNGTKPYRLCDQLFVIKSDSILSQLISWCKNNFSYCSTNSFLYKFANSE